MAGLLSRASTVVKARISKLLDKAEDPSVTLDYSYEKQLEMLQKVTKGAAASGASGVFRRRSRPSADSPPSPCKSPPWGRVSRKLQSQLGVAARRWPTSG